jgi:DNA adenine methylase
LLKWIGSKFKFANQIVSYFPQEFDRFIEPFVGTGAILATVAPSKGVASDSLKPLIELWNLLQNGPEELIEYYERAITDFYVDRQRVYERILRKYNDSPNPFDLLVISRTCYGGVMRFTREGKISTPIGPHKPIPPEAFAERAQ